MLIMAIVLLVTGCSNSSTEKEVPLYYNSTDNQDTIYIALMGESNDIPYISLETLTDLLNKIYQEGILDETSKYPDYELTLETDGNEAVLTRETGYTLAFNFKDDTMEWLDYDAFIKVPKGDALYNFGASGQKTEDGKDKYIIEAETGHVDRYGHIITLNLADYGIDIIRSGSDYYIPLQTFSDFFISFMEQSAFYNGELVILSNPSGMHDSTTGDLSELGEIYYSVEPNERSEALAEFTYGELCLALDSLYGLKEAHDIDSFDELFIQTGLKDRLLDSDPYVFDKAIYDMIEECFDDLHSRFTTVSYFNQDMASSVPSHTGDMAAKFYGEEMMKYSEARDKYYPDGIKGYEEVGNTAYITFDEFTSVDDTGMDYYKDDEPSVDSDDTFGLLIYAYNRITRQGSPVENVVMDLSLNLGGASDAAAYAIGMFLGDSPSAKISVKNTFSGALITNHYYFDTNLDGIYDERDTLADKGYNLYCLTSPVSFSCGNLVPCVLKESADVTLLGRTSGGGSCMVLPLSTASGTGFQISGFYRMSFTKNGSFYDIDRGAEPDYIISQPEDYYDRQKLTRYINSLY